MNMHDPIADMLTRIRNAQSVAKSTVTMPNSTLKVAIAKVLESEGYIHGFDQVRDESDKAVLTINLKYHEGRPVISRLEKISRPSLRIYKVKTKLPQVDNGLGIAIVSTSKGVMTAHQARQLGVGGEVLCEVS